MTPIYTCSAGMIGLMVFAAVSNRRSGWRKQRGTALRDVYEMSAVWKGLQNTEKPQAGMPLPAEANLTVESVASFSHQLANLQAALSPQGRIVPEMHARVEVKVPA